jgi:hypothetical protein
MPLGTVLIGVDTAQVSAFSEKIAGLSAEKLAAVGRNAVNSQIDIAQTQAKQAMSGIQLNGEYIASQFRVSKAQGGAAYASLTSAADAVSLLKYPNRQLKRTGAGKKLPNAGVAIIVADGGILDHGFYMTAKSGPGIFTRGKDGSIRKRYGPSVYQLFNKFLVTSETDIEKDLLANYTARLDSAVSETFK